jgi:hypothetical protein
VGFDVFFWRREKTGFFGGGGEGAFVIWVEEVADDEHCEVFGLRERKMRGLKVRVV